MILLPSTGRVQPKSFHPAGCGFLIDHADSYPYQHHYGPDYGSLTRLRLPTMPQVEQSAASLTKITGAHGRPEPDAIDLPLVGLIRFVQEQRSARTLTLTMSPRDR